MTENESFGQDGGSSDGKKGLSSKYITEAVEASLQRLQTDYIHLYQAHTDDAETPLEETLTAFDSLVKQGKVRVIGASNYSGARLKKAIEISHPGTAGEEQFIGDCVLVSLVLTPPDAASAGGVPSAVAAHLANRVAPTERGSYLAWANREWMWFQQSGMINSQNLINDGLDFSTCKNNGQNTWTYNQGVILGGLVELDRAQRSPQLLSTAHTIADAAITHLSDSNGVLHDTCEPNCGADGVQFKGIFMRNLMALNVATPDPQYETFALTNAESIWNHSRDASNAFGQVWSGPFDAANAGSQSSALDAFVAAYADSLEINH